MVIIIMQKPLRLGVERRSLNVTSMSPKTDFSAGDHEEIINKGFSDCYNFY